MVVASGDVRLPKFLRREAGAEVDRLYRRYADEVLRYALLVLHSRTDAEDITQTVFLRALRAIERGEKVRTPRNWLIKITHNECRRLLATRKVLVELPDQIAVEPVEQGRAEELKLAMAALPATQRQALVLRELEGRTYVEVARTLGISASAVETLIFRARRTLREQIENAMSCEEFAALLDDPSARSRVRAHARVCADCATLDHQSRGRKSALKRIASALSLPWWGAKLAAVAVTTATVAAVAVAVPHDATRPAPSLNLIPPSRMNLIPPGSHPKLVARVGGTRFKSFAPKQAHARPVAAAPKQVPHTAATPTPAVTPAPPLPDPPQPGEPPLPPAAVVPATAVPAAPPVTVPQTTLTPAPEVPTVTVPT
ncbi:MAG: polymerase sigma factor, sigma-70 family, partial [Actinomycetia bacterium]|nr:polymerase sigma factor, sigma-70 family [Actinomycetes bacterium]